MWWVTLNFCAHLLLEIGYLLLSYLIQWLLYITSASLYLVDSPDGLWDSNGNADLHMGSTSSSSKVLKLWSSFSYVRHDGPQKQEF